MSGLPSSTDIVPALIASLFGLVVGSFANVCIHRIPLEESIVFPASRCPNCRAEIPPWQNLPLLSWILLRGRCARCHQPISIRYPIVEAMHGVGFGGLVLSFGLTPFTPFLCFFFFSLTVLAFIDWDHQVLPDVMTLPGVVIGLLSTLVPGAFVTWKEAALAAVFGYVAFFLVAEGYARFRGLEGLGQGDWKLSAMMGAFLGPRRLMLAVFLGSFSGMIYGLVQAMKLRRATSSRHETEVPADGFESQTTNPDQARDPSAVEPAVESSLDAASTSSIETQNPVSIGLYRLPFGTFLAASAIFVLFFGDRVLRWYSSFFPY